MTLGYRKREAHYEPYFSECSRPRRMFMEETEQYLVRYTEFFFAAAEKRSFEKDRYAESGASKTGTDETGLEKKRVGSPGNFCACLWDARPGRRQPVWSASFFRRCAGHRYGNKTAEKLSEQELCENHVWNKNPL